MPWKKEGIATADCYARRKYIPPAVEMPWKKEGIATSLCWPSITSYSPLLCWNALKKGRDCDLTQPTCSSLPSSETVEMPWKKEGIATPLRPLLGVSFFQLLKCPEKRKGLRHIYFILPPPLPKSLLKCPEKRKGLRPVRLCGSSFCGSGKVEMPWKKEGIATLM